MESSASSAGQLTLDEGGGGARAAGHANRKRLSFGYIFVLCAPQADAQSKHGLASVK